MFVNSIRKSTSAHLPKSISRVSLGEDVEERHERLDRNRLFDFEVALERRLALSEHVADCTSEDCLRRPFSPHVCQECEEKLC